MQYLIKNVFLPIGKGFNNETSDIGISDGKIVAPNALSNPEIINGTGLIALPGLIDLHSHLREPGNFGMIETETKAAARGGYTDVFAMPNTVPVVDNEYLANYVKNKCSKYANVHPIASITKNEDGLELTNMELIHTNANVNIFSDDGKCVTNSEVMFRALEYASGLDIVLAQHSEDSALTVGAQMNGGDLANELGLTQWDSVAETSIIARDILFAEKTNAKLHICHISTANSVELVRIAKKRGIKVTAEVTPHHLYFDESIIKSYNPVYKVNPPLRHQSDIKALIDGLKDGTIDIIATDHAPHPIEKKEMDFVHAANGMLGFETALSVINELLVKTNILTWEDVIQKMVNNPAKIGNIKPNEIEVNDIANLTLFSPDQEWVFSQSYSKCSNSPWLNKKLTGKVLYTFLNGKITYDAEI